MNYDFSMHSKVDMSKTEQIDRFPVSIKRRCDLFKGKEKYYAVFNMGNDDGDWYWVFTYTDRPSQEDVKAAYEKEFDKV